MASRNDKNVPFSSIHVKYANKTGTDVTAASKKNREFIRRNFDTVIKHWPELRASHKANRDSAPYPKTIPAKLADAIVARDLSKVKVTRKAMPKVTPTAEVPEVTSEA